MTNTSKVRMPLLIDEPPMLVYPSLAERLGNINKAVMLQQVHFLLNAAQASDNQYNFVEGFWWVYNTYPEWQSKYFRWLSESSIKGLFNQLEYSDGLIVSIQGVKDRFDRRKWYRINYPAFVVFASSNGQNLSDGNGQKLSDENGQNLSNDYRNTETPSETPTENNSEAAPSDTFPEDIPPVRQRNPIFDAVATYIFEVDPNEIGGDGGRIGAIAAWLSGTSDGIGKGRARRVVGLITSPAEPKHVQAFAGYWKTTGASLPLDLVKFVDAWRKWARQRRAVAQRQAASHTVTPLLSEPTEQERAQLTQAVKTVRPAWERGGNYGQQ